MMSLLSFRNLGAARSLPAIIGLFAVALLTVPDLAAGWQLGFRLQLGLVWALYAFQLARGLFQRQRGQVTPDTNLPNVIAVVVPALALIWPATRPDAAIFCGVWVLKPLGDLTAFRLVLRVLANEARNLFGVMSIFGIILFVASFFAYLLEHAAQPDTFRSIPQAMWWAITTLTTTGYGDAIPQSLFGRILAGTVMMCGIGVFALWAAILATGFAEELRRQDFILVWKLVADVPLFATLPHRDLAEIVRALKPRRLPAGSVICSKGQMGNEMFFLQEGTVSIAASPPVTLGPGQYFGEMALISGEPRSATVTAATPVTLLALHISDFQLLIDEGSGLADAVRQTAEDRRRSRAET